jgi:hypothetical protein
MFCHINSLWITDPHLGMTHQGSKATTSTSNIVLRTHPAS